MFLRWKREQNDSFHEMFKDPIINVYYCHTTYNNRTQSLITQDHTHFKDQEAETAREISKRETNGRYARWRHRSDALRRPNEVGDGRRRCEGARFTPGIGCYPSSRTLVEDVGVAGACSTLTPVAAAHAIFIVAVS